MKRPKLISCVALKRDLPEFLLKAGDVGVVVEVFTPDAVMVEFMDADGDTVAIIDLNDADVRRLSDEEARKGQSASPLPAGVDVFMGDASRPRIQR